MYIKFKSHTLNVKFWISESSELTAHRKNEKQEESGFSWKKERVKHGIPYK